MAVRTYKKYAAKNWHPSSFVFFLSHKTFSFFIVYFRLRKHTHTKTRKYSKIMSKKEE